MNWNCNGKMTVMRNNMLSLILFSSLLIGCDRDASNKSVGNGSTPQAAATTSPAEEFPESDPVKLTPEAIKRFSIRIEKLSKKSLTNTFIAPAKISLNMEAVAHVGSPVSGRIVEAKARAGDSVQKGDVLLVIDSPELGEAESDLLQKRTALVVANSTLEISKSAYERAKKLTDETLTVTEVQKREGEYKTAEGMLLSAKAAITAAENKLKLLGVGEDAIARIDKTGIDTRYSIRSPLAGRVIERSVTLGELVRPERDSLLIVADMRVLWVLVDVPEARLKDINIGSKVLFTMPSSDGKALEGAVSYISPRLEESTRTIPVRVELAADPMLLPGMFAQAEISVPSKGASVLAVPEAAVQTIDGKPHVFIPVKGVENAFVARRIKAGPPVGQMFPILGGLKEGDPYVAAGSFILKADLGKGAVQEE